MRVALIVAGVMASLGGAASGQEAPHKPVVTNPDWARMPDGADLVRVFPQKALAANLNGTATISCGITANGRLDRCQVVAEHPKDYGFGEAALRLADTFRMQPKTVDGTPVDGGSVRIPIVFRTPRGQAMASLMTNPAWRTTPSPAAIAAAYPKAAADISGGSAVVRCAFEDDGRTKNCKVISEAPARKGFGEAALKLADSFVVGGLAFNTVPFVLADIPFAFRNPAMPQEPPKLTPQWVRTLTPTGAAKLFPAEALAANVLTGLGVANCAASATGEMVDCQQEREDPPGLGFGAAGLEAAKLMAMNPWTATGEPVEGRRVSLPIRFRFEDLAAPPPRPSAHSRLARLPGRAGARTIRQVGETGL